MKKICSVALLFLLGFIFSGCPGDGSVTYKTIKTVHAVLFSFDENGIFPHLEEFDINQLGIGVYADSLTDRVEIAQSFSLGDQAYASDNPNEIIYTNAIESLNIITLYNFDADHPAGSNVNDILLLLDDMGATSVTDVNGISGISISLKFSAIPLNDSLQFEISGQITGEGEFIETTDLIIPE